MGREHTLDLYPCTGTPTCLGCFTVGEPGGDDDEGGAAAGGAGGGGPAPAENARRAGEAAAASDAAHEPRLYAAAWSTPQARDGDDVQMNALAQDIDDGTAAVFRIFEADVETPDDFIEEITGAVRGGRAEGAWTYRWTDDDESAPDDFEEYRAPEYYFVVQCAGRPRRRSPSCRTYCARRSGAAIRAPAACTWPRAGRCVPRRTRPPRPPRPVTRRQVLATVAVAVAALAALAPARPARCSSGRSS